MRVALGGASPPAAQAPLPSTRLLAPSSGWGNPATGPATGINSSDSKRSRRAENGKRVAAPSHSKCSRYRMFKDLNDFISALDRERELARIGEVTEVQRVMSHSS